MAKGPVQRWLCPPWTEVEWGDTELSQLLSHRAEHSSSVLVWFAQQDIFFVDWIESLPIFFWLEQVLNWNAVLVLRCCSLTHVYCWQESIYMVHVMIRDQWGLYYKQHTGLCFFFFSFWLSKLMLVHAVSHRLVLLWDFIVLWVSDWMTAVNQQLQFKCNKDEPLPLYWCLYVQSSIAKQNITIFLYQYFLTPLVTNWH